jgi:hypothetical protein
MWRGGTYCDTVLLSSPVAYIYIYIKLKVNLQLALLGFGVHISGTQPLVGCTGVRC